MTTIDVPGKLFLLGEYAVLAGGPSVLTSTADRKIRLTQSDAPHGYRTLGANFPDPSALPTLITSALDLSSDVVDSLTVDLRDFYGPRGQKLGLGSSAASTVALVKALKPALPIPDQAALALDLHRQFQNGHGSGADVIACTYAHPLAFRVAEVDPAFAEISLHQDFPGPSIELLSLPDDLQLLGIWTGAPASTTSFMRPVRLKAQTHPTELRALLLRIATIAARGIKAAHTNDTAAFLRALDDGDQAMESLGRFCDLPILTDTHRALRSRAHSAGFVLKPSGAGGGDFSLLAGPSHLPRPAFLDDFLHVALKK